MNKNKVYDRQCYLIMDNKTLKKAQRAEEKSHRCGGCLRYRFDKGKGECLSCGFTWDGHKPKGTRSEFVGFEFPHIGTGTTLLTPQEAKVLFDSRKTKFCSLVYVNMEVPPENYSNYEEFLEYVEDAIVKEMARVRHEDDIRYCAVCRELASINHYHFDIENHSIQKAVYLCELHHKRMTKIRRTPQTKDMKIDDMVEQLKNEDKVRSYKLSRNVESKERS